MIGARSYSWALFVRFWLTWLSSRFRYGPGSPRAGAGSGPASESATGTATNPDEWITASAAGDSTTDWAALNLGPALPRRQRLAARLVVIEVVVEDHDADTPVTLHRITEQCALVGL